MLFVIIGGASASGKTGLANELLAQLNAQEIHAQKLNMDDYYHEIPDGVDISKYRVETNFDTPDMLDLDLFRSHLIQLNKGNPIKKSCFCFATNKRVEGAEEVVNPSEVLIIEGVFAQYFYQKYMPDDLATFTINVTTESYKDLLARRVERDLEQKRKDKKEDVITQELRFVGPGFLRYIASQTVGSDLYVINKCQSPEKQKTEQRRVVNEIISALKERLKLIKAGATFVKKPKPDVCKMVANSHQKAKYLCDKKGFLGHFNSFFGVETTKESTPDKPINRCTIL